MPALHTQRFFLALLLILCHSGSVQAGAWTKHKDEWQLILSGNYYNATQRYDDKGNRQSLSAYNKYEISPYFEYGLTNSLTVGASLSLQAAAQTVTYTNYSVYAVHIDPGDSEFFAKGLLFDNGKAVVSATGLVKLPSPRFATNLPAIGSSSPDVAGGISAGYNFPLFQRNHFIDGGILYRYRFGDPKDQVNLTATLGARLTEKWMLMPQAFATFRTDKPAVSSYTQSSGDDYNEVKLQLSAVYSHTPTLSFQAGIYGTVDGKNVGIGRGLVFSVWRSF